ncbi:hypothetical protein K443DRAFT_673811 [Laccaria amethystina LaAM-08-1]|uniref:RlpA-like protein double-psi beta-barrel domain-containing protein n=1 Tax=Laccaria amethystina LaAM-08-1 TaxID=1095629 RepID=A0A0C9XZ17_9AGAR|nr:hypothetical protein K443DRAFT_673811 [Laccaria amethystina LaAM-08-1]
MAFIKCLVLLLSVAASTDALATPHAARHSVHHRAIAARVADPAPLDVLPVPIRKRADTKRCKQRASSSVLQVSSSTPPVIHAVNTPVPTQPTTTPPPQQATTTYKPVTPTTTTKVAAPASGNQPSFMYGTQTGQGTFYATGLGSCGITNKDTDYIAAVSHLLYDQYPGYSGVNPNNNPICGRSITARYQGKSVTVAVTDRCEGCAITDLDFSPSAFNQLADFSVGRISGMTWTWN